MDITAQIETDDHKMGRLWNRLVAQVDGVRVPLLWQETPDLRCARLHLLPLHLGERVNLGPEDWLWWRDGRAQYPRRYRAFYTRMPAGQDMTWIELYRRRQDAQLVMLIRWCIGGMFERFDDYPFFEWAIAQVVLTPEQSRGMLWWQGPGAPRLIDLDARLT